MPFNGMSFFLWCISSFNFSSYCASVKLPFFAKQVAFRRADFCAFKITWNEKCHLSSQFLVPFCETICPLRGLTECSSPSLKLMRMFRFQWHRYNPVTALPVSVIWRLTARCQRVLFGHIGYLPVGVSICNKCIKI